MNFVVIGAGGVGAIYGAKLAQAGEDVTLVDVRADHVAAMQSNGLVVDGASGDFTVPVHTALVALDGTLSGDSLPTHDVDVALIAVNSYSTSHAARTAQQYLKPDGYALTLQNGLGNMEALQEVLGAERVAGGITFHGAAAHSPGCVTHSINGKSPIGELDGSKSQRIQDLANALERAGLTPEIEDDIMATIWGKFVHNCGLNGIVALTDLRPGHIRMVPELMNSKP